MDYRDMAHELGFPVLPNACPRPKHLGLSLSKRIEGYAKKPGFSQSVRNLRRISRAKEGNSNKRLGPVFSRQVRRMIIPEERLLPHLGSPPNKENRDPRMASKEAPVLEDFNTSEIYRELCSGSAAQLLCDFCKCWVERPFHNKCSNLHDNFVEIAISQLDCTYKVLKEALRRYCGLDKSKSRVKNFGLFIDIVEHYKN